MQLTEQLLPGSYGSYYNTVTPGYGYGGDYRPGYPAARRVAIHRARWTEPRPKKSRIPEVRLSLLPQA